MRRLWRDWDQFWFAPQTARVLGAYRILIGMMTLYSFGLLAKDIPLYFSDGGVVRASALSSMMDREWHTVLTWVISPAAVMIMFGLLVLAALCFTVGLWTRASTVILYVLLVSFHERNNMALNSGDTLLRCTLFFFMFAPAGAAWSVDALRRRLSRPEGGAEPAMLVAPWTQRMMQVQLAVVYLTTAYAKLRGDLWHSGHALYYVFGLVDYHVRGVEQLMNHPVLYSSLTFGTLFVEAAIPFLLWFRPARPYAFGAGLLLHGWTMVGMTLPVFGTLMLCAYLPFVTEEELKGFLDRWAGKFRPAQMWFDGRCPLCQRSRRVMQVLDLFHRIEWVDLHHAPKGKWPKGKTKEQLMDAMHLSAPPRGGYDGFQAFRRAAWMIPAFWVLAPLLYVPGVPFLGKRLYRWVAMHRYILVRCDDPQACRIHQM